jgi:hypothetical protein
VGASVTLVTPSVAVEPGAEVGVEVRVRNTGSVVDEFSLDVLGDAAAWATIDPPTISLFPGAEGASRILFRPPRASTTPPGVTTFGLRARSREDPAGSAVEEGSIEVGAFVEPFAELVPRTSRGSRGATHELALDNRGNARLNTLVEAGDADRLLTFDVNPPGVVVDPGMAGFAKIRVKPAQRFWRGQPRSRAFQVVVTPEGRIPLTLEGSTLQEAVLPPWFGRLLAMLLVAVIGSVLLWAFVLRPSIETAVGMAVASPIASLRDDVNQALGAAGLPTMPAGATGSATPTPTMQPATAAPASAEPAEPGSSAEPPIQAPSPTPDGGVSIPGLGVPVDGVLKKNVQSVPVAGTMFVTDLVFSNPNGQEGAVVVLRNATPLLQLRLDNFRDYDLHFVTPIVIPNGESLNLSLECTRTDKACDPQVFYSGYLRP